MFLSVFPDIGRHPIIPDYSSSHGYRTAAIRYRCTFHHTRIDVFVAGFRSVLLQNAKFRPINYLVPREFDATVISIDIVLHQAISIILWTIRNFESCEF